MFLDIFFFVFKSCLWQPNETVWQNRNHESWTHEEEASLSSSEQRVRFLFETSRIDAYSRLYFILAQGQKTTILHESFKERIDFLTATCRSWFRKEWTRKVNLVHQQVIFIFGMCLTKLLNISFIRRTQKQDWVLDREMFFKEKL